MIMAIDSIDNSLFRTVSGDSSGTPSLARSRINKPPSVVIARIIDPLQVSSIRTNSRCAHKLILTGVRQHEPRQADRPTVARP